MVHSPENEHKVRDERLKRTKKHSNYENLTPKLKIFTPTAWHTAYPKIKDPTPILKTHWHTDVQIVFFG